MEPLAAWRALLSCWPRRGNGSKMWGESSGRAAEQRLFLDPLAADKALTDALHKCFVESHRQSPGSLVFNFRVFYLEVDEGPQAEVVEESDMNLSPVEAINRINETVTVEMTVQRTKCCTGSQQVFLDSETTHRDPKNLGVVVTEAGRAKFAEAGIDDPTGHYKGKTIRVRGVVTRREDRPYIEVNDPSQIELVK
jgi:hypothetical protein